MRESSLWFDALRRLWRRKLAVAAALYLLLLLLATTFAPYLAPYPYDEQNLDRVSSSWTQQHPLGTDELGRDILSRLLYGGRISLGVAVLVSLLKLVIGIPLGLLAGFFGGWTDLLITRLIDVLFAFPTLLLAILVVGIRGPGVENVILALALVTWPSIARIVRGQAMQARELDYVQAARSLGSSNSRILARHVLPNVVSPLIVTTTLGLAHVMLAEAALSFLGIGVRPPMPSWGSMVNELRPFLWYKPELLLAPCLLLASCVLAFNFLGDGLRDALDPRLKH